jgi:hypothetical protein
MDISEEVINNIETFNDLRNLVKAHELSLVEGTNPPTTDRVEQSGGFAMALIPGQIFGYIVDAVKGLLNFLGVIAYRLFSLPGNPFTDDPDGDWNNPNRGQLWKYIWFSIKVGLALIIFAIAGPIFIMIGIGYIYSHLLNKMNVDGPTLVRDRLADAQIS